MQCQRITGLTRGKLTHCTELPFAKKPGVRWKSELLPTWRKMVRFVLKQSPGSGIAVGMPSVIAFKMLGQRAVSELLSKFSTSNVSAVLYCIVLYCIVLYCIVLHCIVLYCICIVLYCIALHCIVLYCIALHCIVLYCIVLYCIVSHCIVLYCIVLYCIVLYCIVLYCIALYFIMQVLQTQEVK